MATTKFDLERAALGAFGVLSPLETALSNIGAVVTALASCRSEAVDAVETEFRRYQRALIARKGILLAEIEAVELAKRTALVAQLASIQALRSNVFDALLFAVELIDTGTEARSRFLLLFVCVLACDCKARPHSLLPFGVRL
jgi:hypothetical protein